MGMKNNLIYLLNNKSLESAYLDFVQHNEDKRSYERNT